jgi:hypothetical protein
LDSVALRSDDQAGQVASPVSVERLCHRSRGLAGADDDRVASRRVGHEPWDTIRGLRRAYCRLERGPQQ